MNSSGSTGRDVILRFVHLSNNPTIEERNELLEPAGEAVKKSFVTASFLHFSLEICILNAETITERMRRIKEKFSLVDEVHSTKFLKIKNQT
jgi:hypothetical protein